MSSLDHIFFLNIEYFFYQIYSFFVRLFRGDFFQDGSLVSFLRILAMIVVLLLITGFFFMYLHLREIKEEQKKRLRLHTPRERILKKSGTRWESVLLHSESESASDWRIAIMEADIMLDELLTTRFGYNGDSIGDKLKQANPQGFKSIDSAWQAHKVRNRIAHDGQAYELTKREIKRVIGLYEEVFLEFSFI